MPPPEEQHNVGCIIIDYLQLMSGAGDNRNGNREQEISRISRDLKGLAKELQVPIIRPFPAEPCRGIPQGRREDTAVERSARIGRHRAGCGHGHVPLSSEYYGITANEMEKAIKERRTSKCQAS